MARLCTVCVHGQRQQIDLELLAHREAMTTIARKYDVGRDALLNHLERHLAARLREDKEAAGILDTAALVAEMRDLHGHARRQMEQAEQSGDGRLVLMAIREGRANVDQLSKLSILRDFETRAKAALALVNNIATAGTGNPVAADADPSDDEGENQENEDDDDPVGA